MSTTDNQDLPIDPPDWFLQKIADMPDPSPHVMAQYAHLIDGMSEDLAERLRAKPANAVHPVVAFAHAIFTKAGKLLEVADEAVQVILAQPQPLTRSLATKSVDQPPSDTLISGIRVMAGDVEIRIEWHRDPAATGPIIEISVLNRDLSPVRPLDITVTDETGALITDPLHVPVTANNPRFPQPSEGIYVFEIAWPPNRRHKVQIDVK